MPNQDIDRLGRLLRYLREHQRSTGTRPMSARAIGRAVGMSHTHVIRLTRRAIKQGLLRVTANGYAFEKITIDESLKGMRWLPTTWCNWKKPICWYEEAGDGYWFPTQLFSLRVRPRAWIVIFDATEPDAGYPPILGPSCLAIVRPLRSPSDARVDQWCLVSFQKRVRSMYRIEGGKFRHDRGVAHPAIEVSVSDVSHVAAIDTLIQNRTPTQNRIQRRISEIVSFMGASDEFRNPGCDASVINVSLDSLRTKWHVPHQLKISGIGDRESLPGKLEPISATSVASPSGAKSVPSNWVEPAIKVTKSADKRQKKFSILRGTSNNSFFFKRSRGPE